MGRGLLGLTALALARLALALPVAVCPDGPPPSSKDLVRDDAPRNGNDSRVPQAPEHPFLGAMFNVARMGSYGARAAARAQYKAQVRSRSAKPWSLQHRQVAAEPHCTKYGRPTGQCLGRCVVAGGRGSLSMSCGPMSWVKITSKVHR